MGRDVLDEHRLRRLIDVGRGLVTQLDLEAVLCEVVEVARELTGARYATLSILDEETRTQVGDLSVPIVVRGQTYGNLDLTEKEGGEFDEADEEAATILAGWAAVAIFNVRLYSQSEEERRAADRVGARLGDADDSLDPARLTSSARLPVTRARSAGSRTGDRQGGLSPRLCKGGRHIGISSHARL